MNMHKILIGVIADDFTGASDIASFLTMSGHSTILFDGTPENHNIPDCECIVIALKSRSIGSCQAVEEVSSAYRFLENAGAGKIYYKYCSTFDSTCEGNIGPVLDWMLEESGQQYTLLCPSLPVNGRTVRGGILYVMNVPLAESPMKNHPLNPMWDSHLKVLMEAQSRYPVYPIGDAYKEPEKLDSMLKEMNMASSHFYLVPDYADDADGRAIAQAFQNLRIISGGSALAPYLIPDGRIQTKPKENKVSENERAVIICGSCSQATKKQINWYRSHGGRTCSIDAEKLLQDPKSADIYKKMLKENDRDILFFSCDEGTVLNKSDTVHFAEVSDAVENINAELGREAMLLGYHRIIVAGGETSGAVAKKLGFRSYYIGETIDPGVPVLKPCSQPAMKLVYKSGNFGSESFFEKALKMQ